MGSLKKKYMNIKCFTIENIICYAVETIINFLYQVDEIS